MKRSLPEGPVSRQSPQELPLFQAPRIESEAPSQASSESSRQAAECVSNPFRRESHRRIMAVLGASAFLMSQWEIAEATGLPINVVCPRVSELEPTWVERFRGSRRSHVKASLKVDGFRLTALGHSRWHRANEPLVLSGQSLEDQK